VILYPAIDLKDGRCVRLKRGNMSEATVFSHDAAAQARSFEEQGFRWLHVVDLDGAFAGRPVNQKVIESILKTVRIPVQLGGGIRDLAGIETWLADGVARVVLGTVAARNPDLVRSACRLFPGRVAVGIDVRSGKVAVEGWAETMELNAVELAQRLGDIGVAAIIFTDIDRDGLLAGINIESTLKIAQAVAAPVIASGGLASLADIARLLKPDCAVLHGAIVGRALYDGRLDARAALKLIAEAA
jgi:phosphoribosylformimino-5-aminoimidazole carboxamide ribotide isomerase